MKPNVRAPASCSRNRCSTEDCGSGQAMRVPAVGPTEISPAHVPAFHASEVAVAAAGAGEAACIIGQRHDRLRSGRIGDIPRTQHPKGSRKSGQGKAARPHGAERVQPVLVECPLPFDELPGAACRVVLSSPHGAHQQSAAIDSGRPELHTVPERCRRHIAKGPAFALHHREKGPSGRATGTVREHADRLLNAVPIEITHDAKVVGQARRSAEKRRPRRAVRPSNARSRASPVPIARRARRMSCCFSS